jgi:hypothetical protein
MELEYEAILMVVMIGIIGYFAYIYLSPFLAAKGSQYYYNLVAGEVSSACSSAQGKTGISFSNPSAFVFQIYDSSACNSLLLKNQNIFYNSYYATDLVNSYDLCYANVTTFNGIVPGLRVLAGSQYYFNSSGSYPIIYFYWNSTFGSFGTSSVSASLSRFSTLNQLGVDAVSANSTNPSFTIILRPQHAVNSSSYSLSLAQYVNVSSNINIVFNGNANCVRQLTDRLHYDSETITSPCSGNITNISIMVTPSPATANLKYNYQVNITADRNRILGAALDALGTQCLSLVNYASVGFLHNGA